MEEALIAVLSGTAIGAAVTGLFSLAKPWIDYKITRATKRDSTEEARQAVVEGVVDRLRKLRLENTRAAVKGTGLPWEQVLEASDAALLIHDQGFAKYLSMDIQNVTGFDYLYDSWAEDSADYKGNPSDDARAARWNHLKTLVERASAYAVTGKWEKEWAEGATKLKDDMDEAADKVHNP